MRYIANIITGSRIVFSLAMLFFPAYSRLFISFYLLAGFSDMIDGTVARLSESDSDFGAKLDTIADITFVSASLIKLLPKLCISKGILIRMAAIAIIKLINIASGYVIQGQFVSIHTAANKITGLLLFLFPLTLTIIDIRYSTTVICIAATFAAIQEGHLIRTAEQKTKQKEDL